MDTQLDVIAEELRKIRELLEKEERTRTPPPRIPWDKLPWVNPNGPGSPQRMPWEGPTYTTFDPRMLEVTYSNTSTEVMRKSV